MSLTNKQIKLCILETNNSPEKVIPITEERILQTSQFLVNQLSSFPKTKELVLPIGSVPELVKLYQKSYFYLFDFYELNYSWFSEPRIHFNGSRKRLKPERIRSLKRELQTHFSQLLQFVHLILDFEYIHKLRLKMIQEGEKKLFSHPSSFSIDLLTEFYLRDPIERIPRKLWLNHSFFYIWLSFNRTEKKTVKEISLEISLKNSLTFRLIRDKQTIESLCFMVKYWLYFQDEREDHLLYTFEDGFKPKYLDSINVDSVSCILSNKSSLYEEEELTDIETSTSYIYELRNRGRRIRFLPWGIKFLSLDGNELTSITLHSTDDLSQETRHLTIGHYDLLFKEGQILSMERYLKLNDIQFKSKYQFEESSYTLTSEDEELVYQSNRYCSYQNTKGYYLEILELDGGKQLVNFFLDEKKLIYSEDELIYLWSEYEKSFQVQEPEKFVHLNNDLDFLHNYLNLFRTYNEDNLPQPL